MTATTSAARRTEVLAALDRLEALANAAAELGGSGEWRPAASFDAVIAGSPPTNDTERIHYGGPVVGESMNTPYREHVLANDPARVLRRLAADRRIATRHDCEEPKDGLFYCEGCNGTRDEDDGGCPDVAALWDAYCGPA